MRKIFIIIISFSLLSACLFGQETPSSIKLIKAVNEQDYNTAGEAVVELGGKISPFDITYFYLKSLDTPDEANDKAINWLFSMIPSSTTDDMINSFKNIEQLRTILHMASMKFYPYAIQKALDHGASPFVRDYKGETPYDMIYNGIVARKGMMGQNFVQSDPPRLEKVVKGLKIVETAQAIMLEAIKKIELEALKDHTTALFFYAERLDLDGIKKAINDGANVDATLKDISASSLYKHLLLANHKDADSPITIAIRNTFIQPEPYQQTPLERITNGLDIIELLSEKGTFLANTDHVPAYTEATLGVINEIKELYDRENVTRIVSEGWYIRDAKKIILTAPLTCSTEDIEKLIVYLKYAKRKNDQKLAKTIVEAMKNYTSTMNSEQLADYNELGAFTKANYVKDPVFEFNEAAFREMAIAYIKEAEPAYRKIISGFTTNDIAQTLLENLIPLLNTVVKESDVSAPVSQLLCGNNGILDYLYQTSKNFPAASPIRSGYIGALNLLSLLSFNYFRKAAIENGYITPEDFTERAARIDEYIKTEAAKNAEYNRLLNEKAFDLDKIIEPFRGGEVY
jgi:hypothetical protein